MKCNCCDAELSEKEIIWNEEIQAWELCSVCLEVALDAAYSQGFTIDDEIPVLEEEWDSYDSSTVPVSGRYYAEIDD